MSAGDKSKMVQESIRSQPVGSIHRLPEDAPNGFCLNLQFKGFGGGVPINTETTAVKPRVGSESWQEVFVLYWDGIGRKRNNASGPLISPVVI
jgi:hypothetical protein